MSILFEVAENCNPTTRQFHMNVRIVIIYYKRRRCYAIQNTTTSNTTTMFNFKTEEIIRKQFNNVTKHWRPRRRIEGTDGWFYFRFL